MYLSYATVDMLAQYGDEMAKKIMRKCASAPGFTPMVRSGMLFIVSNGRVERVK